MANSSCSIIGCKACGQTVGLCDNSAEMTCCAECQLPCVNVETRATSVFVCAISKNAFWFFTINLKHM